MNLSLGGILWGQFNIISNLEKEWQLSDLLAKCQSGNCIFVHEATIQYLKFAYTTAYFGEVSEEAAIELLFLKIYAFLLEPMLISQHSTPSTLASNFLAWITI